MHRDPPVYPNLFRAPARITYSQIKSEYRRVDLHDGPIADRNRMRLVTLSDRMRII